MLRLSSLSKTKTIFYGFALFSVTLSGMLLSSHKVAAIDESNNGWVPSQIQISTVYPNGDCSPKAHAQGNWISPRGRSADLSASVSTGQTGLPLQWQYYSGICNNGLNPFGTGSTRDDIKNLVATYAINTSISASIDGIGPVGVSVGSPNSVAFGYNYNYRYQPLNRQSIPIDVTLPSNLAPGVYRLVINFGNKSAHAYTNNAPGQVTCVKDGSVRSALLSCPEDSPGIPLTLFVNGGSRQPEGNVDGVSCGLGGLSGWAIDPDTPNTPIRVDFYDGPLGVGNGVGSATADRPHDPAETLPYGNPNARFLLDFSRYPSLYRGPHTLYAYAIDSAGGPWRFLGSNTFEYTAPPCSPSNIPSNVVNLVPKAAANLDDDENPQHAVFNSGISTGAPADGTITRRLYIRRGGVEETIPGQPGTENRRLDQFDYLPIDIANPQTALRFATLGNSPFSPGDEICIDVTVTPRQVRVYQDGVVETTDNNPVTNTNCDRFVNKPFLSAYGGDVSAGGGFGTACSASNAGINTNNNAALLGSGVEFAAQAVGVISGFSSARLTNPPKALTFSNNTAALGNFAAGHCIKDYFSKAPANVTAGTEVSPGSLTSGIVKYGSGAGSTTTLHSGNLGDGVRTSLYIDGNLVIDGTGIGYASGSWADTKQIPSLHVYVSGNIWIQSSVLNLNGMFVAQPRSGVPDSGRIITCATGSARVARTDLFNVCGNRLVVNGGLVADRVDFLRAGSSMRLADTGSEGSPSSSKGAEVINMSPEFIMVAPDADHREILKKYQFFTTLPPVL